jgi:hypothetical protein
VYDSLEDERFDWLENEFLDYFRTWKESIDEKDEIDANTKAKMFI